MRPPQALIIALKRRRPRGVSHAWGSHVVHAVLQRAATGWGASARPRTRMPSRREAQPQRRGAARGCDGRVLCGSCAFTCARAAAGARRTESEAFKDDLRCSALVGRRTASGRSPPAYFGTRVPCSSTIKNHNVTVPPVTVWHGARGAGRRPPVFNSVFVYVHEFFMNTILFKDRPWFP